MSCEVELDGKSRFSALVDRHTLSSIRLQGYTGELH
jgi:hypothetical protein